MTLTLRPTEPDLNRLRAIAASGSTGLSKKAKAELQRIMHLQLAQPDRGPK